MDHLWKLVMHSLKEDFSSVVNNVQACSKFERGPQGGISKSKWVNSAKWL